MRLYLTLSKNSIIIPFNYQHLLTGCLHKWIGRGNNEHGQRSLYSFSWLQNTSATNKGINLNRNSYFFISAFDGDLIKQIMRGVMNDPEALCGARIVDIHIKEIPVFSNEEKFFLNSPILIRQREGEKTKHITYLDANFEELLTNNLKMKLQKANLPDSNLSLELDKSYAYPQTKLVNYKGIKNKTTLAPIVIKGSPEQIAFAWQVGLGNSTGIGFGAIK